MSDTAVSVRNVVVSYDSTTALDGINLDVPAGTVAGIAGPDGAGKTTLMRALVGLVTPDKGDVTVLGHSIPDELDALKTSVGYLPQQLGTQRHMTVWENLEYFGRLQTVPPAEMLPRMQELVEVTGLEDFKDRRSENLSGGMRQKLALACAIIHHPDILLLDEPTTGVDPLSRRDLWEFTYGLLEQTESIIVTTPTWEEAARCQWLAIVNRGRTIATGTPEELTGRADGLVFEVAGEVEAEGKLCGMEGCISVGRRGPDTRVVFSASQRETDLRQKLQQRLPDASVNQATPTLEDGAIVLTEENAEDGRLR